MLILKKYTYISCPSLHPLQATNSADARRQLKRTQHEGAPGPGLAIPVLHCVAR